MAEAAGLLQEKGPPGQMSAAIVFVDLSSFTPLTEAMGDVKAAEVLERFSSLVREAAGRRGGRGGGEVGGAPARATPLPPASTPPRGGRGRRSVPRCW